MVDLIICPSLLFWVTSKLDFLQLQNQVLDHLWMFKKRCLHSSNNINRKVSCKIMSWLWLRKLVNLSCRMLSLTLNYKNKVIKMTMLEQALHWMMIEIGWAHLVVVSLNLLDQSLLHLKIKKLERSKKNLKMREGIIKSCRMK